MSKKSTVNDPYPHVKYTKYGFPYVDADELLSGELGKELHERMKLIREISENAPDLNNKKTKKTTNESS